MLLEQPHFAGTAAGEAVGWALPKASARIAEVLCCSGTGVQIGPAPLLQLRAARGLLAGTVWPWGCWCCGGVAPHRHGGVYGAERRAELGINAANFWESPALGILAGGHSDCDGSCGSARKLLLNAFGGLGATDGTGCTHQPDPAATTSTSGQLLLTKQHFCSFCFTKSSMSANQATNEEILHFLPTLIRVGKDSLPFLFIASFLPQTKLTAYLQEEPAPLMWCMKHLPFVTARRLFPAFSEVRWQHNYTCWSFSEDRNTQNSTAVAHTHEISWHQIKFCLNKDKLSSEQNASRTAKHYTEPSATGVQAPYRGSQTPLTWIWMWALKEAGVHGYVC